MVHQIVKAEKLSLLAVGMLEQELKVINLFRKEGIDQFKGALDDTMSVTVEGVLPYRSYAWRNDRSSPIVFDDYSERKIAVTFGGQAYSAVKVTDEQFDFDIMQWGKLLRPQVKAVARGIEHEAIAMIENQTYQVTIGDSAANLRGALIEARRVLNAFNVPDGDRYLLCGSGFESALLNDDKLRLALNVGDNRAESNLAMATLGMLYGMRVIVDQSLDPDYAYAFAGSAFIFLSGAPSVPSSVGFGATASLDGIAMRWIRDYDPNYLQDRSVVSTFYGFRAVEDVLMGFVEGANTVQAISADEYFVRGVKLKLTGASDYPNSGTEIANITGVSSERVFASGGATVEAPVSIAVTPASPALAVAGTVQMIATATWATGPTTVVTNRVTWASATPAKATITAGGLVTGVAAGTSVLSATLGAVVGNTTTTVS